MTHVCTTCPYCGVGCGVLASADGTIGGDPDHPANKGQLCSKGSALGDTIGLEGRLLSPRVYGEVSTWDSALTLVAQKFQQAINEHGPDSVAFYLSGQLLTEDYYVANKLIKGYMGTANIDTNSRLCMASTVAGHKRAFGTDTVPGQYEDLELADLVVLVGSNLAWCHPVLYQRLAAAKAKRPSLKVVVVDPRHTATCDIADLHLPISSDGDIALFNGLLCYLADHNAIDADFVGRHVDGFSKALATARMGDPSQSGLSPDALYTFYRLFCETENAVTVFSQGVNQSACGTDKVNAILNCHLATGRIGRPGMGPFSVTGQPNAMGGREVGGLSNMLTCHLDLENASHRDAVQSAWSSPKMANKAGLKAVDLFEACADGRIKALWIMSTNPAVSMPNADSVAAAIQEVPFTVVTDIQERTDTGDLADVLLPAAGWGEKSGTVTNSERLISRQRAFLPAPGQARPDWAIISDVAKRMGYQGFDYRSEAEIFREFAGLSRLGHQFGRVFDIIGWSDISAQYYDILKPTVWPLKSDIQSGGRVFGTGAFFHDHGQAKMLPIAAPERAKSAGLTLNTGRIRDQWHTMTRTGRSAKLTAHLAEPYVEVHPEDAMSLGLRDADLAELQSPQGTAITRVLISHKVQAGSVFVPMHWTAQHAPAGRVNPLVDAVTDPVSGQPASKGTAVSLKRAEIAWFGFVVSTKPLSPTTRYWAMTQAKGGWRCELGDSPPAADWQAFLTELTGHNTTEMAFFEDPTSGTARAAFYQNGLIQALAFIAPHPVEVARSHAVSLLNQPVAALSALAGRAGTDQPDSGPTICACFDVGLNTLRAEIKAGANTVETLGERTCAGTNCGSCKSELAALIRAQHSAVAAE